MFQQKINIIWKKVRGNKKQQHFFYNKNTRKCVLALRALSFQFFLLILPATETKAIERGSSNRILKNNKHERKIYKHLQTPSNKFSQTHTHIPIKLLLIQKKTLYKKKKNKIIKVNYKIRKKKKQQQQKKSTTKINIPTLHN